MCLNSENSTDIHFLISVVSKLKDSAFVKLLNKAFLLCNKYVKEYVFIFSISKCKIQLLKMTIC